MRGSQRLTALLLPLLLLLRLVGLPAWLPPLVLRLLFLLLHWLPLVLRLLCLPTLLMAG